MSSEANIISLMKSRKKAIDIPLLPIFKQSSDLHDLAKNRVDQKNLSVFVARVSVFIRLLDLYFQKYNVLPIEGYIIQDKALDLLEKYPILDPTLDLVTSNLEEDDYEAIEISFNVYRLKNKEYLLRGNIIGITDRWTKTRFTERYFTQEELIALIILFMLTGNIDITDGNVDVSWEFHFVLDWITKWDLNYMKKVRDFLKLI